VVILSGAVGPSNGSQNFKDSFKYQEAFMGKSNDKASVIVQSEPDATAAGACGRGKNEELHSRKVRKSGLFTG
jgi:hypothetical protein